MEVFVEKLTSPDLIRELCRNIVSGESKVTLRQIYAALHSPARSQIYKVTLHDIPTFVSVSFTRHKFGAEHFVKSNREDRPGHTGDKGRWQPVNHILIVNAEELIRMAHRRLCGQAHEEARKLMAMIRDSIALIDPDLASLMVPLCIYRNGLCDELPHPCVFNKTIKIITDV